MFRYNPIINNLFPRSNFLVTAMDVDNQNNLWVGTTEGLIYYEIENIRYNFLTQGAGLAGNDISAIYCDSKGIVWIGSRGKGLTSIEADILSHIVSLHYNASY